MPLDPTSFVPKGPVKSLDIRQFYDLFTGVMVDQPITFRNAVSIGGDQGIATVPLRIFGAPGQNTNLVDLYPDRTSAQPGFGFSAVGAFAWGPGGTAPQDTFLSRIATQHGYVTDTPGLLVTPMMQVGGQLNVERDLIVDALGQNTGTGLAPGIQLGGNTGEGIASQRASSGGSNRFGLDFWTGGVINMKILNGGDIQMAHNLTLAASVNAGGDGNFHYVTVSDGSNGVVVARNGSLYLRPAAAGNWIVNDVGFGFQTTVGSIYAPAGYIAAGPTITGSPGDLSANRNNGTGYVFLANGSHYVGFDGNVYQFPTSPLFSVQLQTPNGAGAILIGGGGVANSGGANIAFAQSLGAKLCLYDNGGGGYWGIGMNSNEMYMSIPAPGTWGLRAGAGNGAGPLTFWVTDGGFLHMNGDITLNPPRTLNLGSAIVSPGTNIGKSADTVYLSAHAYVFFDLGVGHVVTCQQVIQTSDPSLKAVTGTLSDDQCMGRIRGGLPVYQYQLSPPTPPPDQPPNPTPTQTDIGFMATDVFANSPEFVALDSQGQPVGVNYANMSALIWGALRQLDARCVAKGI